MPKYLRNVVLIFEVKKIMFGTRCFSASVKSISRGVSSGMASTDSFLEKNCTGILSHYAIDFSCLAKLILLTKNWKIYFLYIQKSVRIWYI